MTKNVWVVINNGSYQVFTELEAAKACEGVIVIAPLNPPVERTYKVTAYMGSGVFWEVVVCAETSKSSGWDRYSGRSDLSAYHWHVQATSRTEALDKAKQLFRDSI